MNKHFNGLSYLNNISNKHTLVDLWFTNYEFKLDSWNSIYDNMEFHVFETPLSVLDMLEKDNEHS